MSLTLTTPPASLDLSATAFAQNQVLKIVGLKATDIQNWTNRGLLGGSFLNHGRGKHRTYSVNDCLLLGLMLRLRTVGFSAREAVEWIFMEWPAKPSLATLLRTTAAQLIRNGTISPVVLLEIVEFGEPLNGLRYNIMAHELAGPNFEMDVFAVMRESRKDHIIFIDLTEIVHRVIDGVVQAQEKRSNRAS